MKLAIVSLKFEKIGDFD